MSKVPRFLTATCNNKIQPMTRPVKHGQDVDDEWMRSIVPVPSMVQTWLKVSVQISAFCFPKMTTENYIYNAKNI